MSHSMKYTLLTSGLYQSLFSAAFCEPKDDDACLQQSPEWDDTYQCSTSIDFCTSYGKDMRRCCPDSCGSGLFTLDKCIAFDGLGTCTYPNDAQCSGNN